MLRQLTVENILTHAALSRLPTSMTSKQVTRLVESVIKVRRARGRALLRWLSRSLSAPPPFSPHTTPPFRILSSVVVWSPFIARFLCRPFAARRFEASLDRSRGHHPFDSARFWIWAICGTRASATKKRSARVLAFLLARVSVPPGFESVLSMSPLSVSHTLSHSDSRRRVRALCSAAFRAGSASA